MGASSEYFNAAALFITFRETVEAVIILTVLFGFLDKSGQRHLKRSVRWGLASGILAALSVGSAFIVIFYEAKQNIFSDENEKLFEGIVMLVACFFITSLAFSMLRMFQMQLKWETRFATATETATGKGDSMGGGAKGLADPKWTFFILACTSVFREGVETFVFMAGVAQADPRSLPIPGVIGVIVGIIFGFFLFRGAKPANLAIFFYISTFMLFLIAAGLFSRGVHEFQELGEFGVYWEKDTTSKAGRRRLIEAAVGLDGEVVVDKMAEGAATSDFFDPSDAALPVSWANTPLADWRDCCSDQDDEFYVLLRAIFGYRDVPTRLEVVTYCGYWLMALLILIYKMKKGTLYGKQHLKAAAGGGEDVNGIDNGNGDGSLKEQSGDIQISEKHTEKAGLALPPRAKVASRPMMIVVDPLSQDDNPDDLPAPEAPPPHETPASRALLAVGKAFAKPDFRRSFGELCIWLSIIGLVIGLLCASLLPGLDLTVIEIHDGLLGSAPFPELGITRRFTLVIQQVQVPLPGGGFKTMITANGTTPGPELRVRHGDWVEVNVINMMRQNTTVHWHGIVHRSSPFADGVVGFTQCAIPAAVGGQDYPSVIYRFESYYAGTFWYHGHLDSQYVDGLYGPLIVEGIPEQNGALYSYDWVWMAADWYRGGADDIARNVFLSVNNPDGYEPMPDAITVNGKFSGDLRFSARRGDKVRVRFINSASWSPWNVSVDGVPLTVIELDGQDVQPIAAPWVVVNVAQRVSFVIDLGAISGVALRNSPELYFRVEAMADTYPLGLEGNYGNQGYKKLDPLFLGVIDFGSQGSAPRAAGANAQSRPGLAYPLEAVPVLPVDELPTDQMTAVPMPEANVEKPTHRMMLKLTMENVNGINLGHLNGRTHPSVPYSTPLIYRLVDFLDEYPNKPLLKDVWNPESSDDAAAMTSWDIVPDARGRYVLPFLAVVQMVLFNYDGGPHPFHLHGHKLSLVASSDYPGNEYENGPNYLLRDVVTLPAAVNDTQPGWVKVQFTADNPGIWALHCHIDWHMAAGLLAEIVEAPDQLSLLGGDAVPRSQLKLCGMKSNKTDI